MAVIAYFIKTLLFVLWTSLVLSGMYLIMAAPFCALAWLLMRYAGGKINGKDRTRVIRREQGHKKR